MLLCSYFRNAISSLTSPRLKVKTESESCSVTSSSLWSHGLYSPWNSLDQKTRVGSLSLLQGIFPTQELNWGLLHCRWILCQLRYEGSPPRLKTQGNLIAYFKIYFVHCLPLFMKTSLYYLLLSHFMLKCCFFFSPHICLIIAGYPFAFEIKALKRWLNFMTRLHCGVTALGW